MRNDIAIVIPAFEPDDRLVSYVKELNICGFTNIIVVDDGSGKVYDDIFNRLEHQAKCEVLHHSQNSGKGAALKTGYRYILEYMSEVVIGIITADSDGQHTVGDCINIADVLKSKKSGHVLLLGSRDFSSKNAQIPAKSRFGNKCTSIIFKMMYGIYLPDTQTGLRGFLVEDIEKMCNIDGERYEYEMRVLIEWAREKNIIEIIPIETIYENNNEGTHFHPIRDSYKIYKVIFETFFKYTGISILCFLIDNIFFNIFHYFVLPAFKISSIAKIDWISGCGARIISGVSNYLLNKKFVFKAKKKGNAWRYFLLCVGIICVSNFAVTGFEMIGLPGWLMKPVCDILLYFVSFKINDRWVFE